MREQWAAEREEAKKVEAMRHQVLMQANEELHEFNKQKRSMLADTVAAERQSDMERLQAQLALEAHESEREEAARASMQHETRRFAEHMMMQKRALASKEIGCDPDRSAAFNAAEGTLSIKTGATANHPDRGGRGERSGGVTMLYLGGDDQEIRKARELARSAWTPPHLLACCVPGRPRESAA